MQEYNALIVGIHAHKLVVGISIIVLIGAAFAGWNPWMAQRQMYNITTEASAGAQSSTEEPFLKRAVVFCTFVLLGSLIKLTQHGARNLQYSFLAPVVIISVAKAACSLVLYSVNDGPLSDIPKRLQTAGTVVLRYSAVAALFCLYDVLSFVNLARLDPQTYLVFLQLRTVCTGVVWEIAFKKALTWAQRGGLLLICCGCIAKQAGAGLSSEAARNISTSEYALLGVQVTANCLAGVANEVLLKQKGSVPLNLQNIVQYSWTIVWCMLVGVLCPTEGVHLNPFDMAAWRPMLDPVMLPNIVILTVLGLTTSVMLKILNSVWKAVATSVELFFTSFASALVFGYAVTFGDGVSLCIAAAGVSLYALGGEKAAPTVAPPSDVAPTASQSKVSKDLA